MFWVQFIQASELNIGYLQSPGKILELTRKGKKELRLLETCLRDAERVFLDLYQEIECDLSAVTRRAMKVLSSKSILDRIATAKLRGLRAFQSSDENEENLK